MKKAVVALLLTALLAGAKPREVQSRWSDLDRELVRSRVMIATSAGKTVEGEYAGLQGDEIRVTTKKGEVTVARSTITDLRRVEQTRARGRIIGTVAGAVGGLMLGAALAIAVVDDDSGEAAQALGIWLGTAAGAGTLGYFIGKELDKKTTRIVILP